MMVCLIGNPLRYACLELERVGATREESFWSAIWQFDATDFAVFDLIALPKPEIDEQTELS